MCGIVGYIQKKEDRQTLQLMMDKISHRGPDGEGAWYNRYGDWFIALGHRRLSIIDLDYGHQPLANEDGSLQIVFNGEIYNFQELRAELEARGHTFSTHSDTESIVHLIEEKGVDGLPELNGMFGFALWNQDKGEILLARDRAGIKPLYYSMLPAGGIAFASELSALLAHPSVSRKLSPEGAYSYFFSDYSHPPYTLVDGAFKLEPGHFLQWKDGACQRPKPFWQLGETEESPERLDEAELSEELWDRLGDAVSRQLVSDVPVGAFLSGGIDSSAIAVLAQQASTGRLQTFSIGFEEASYDESGYARQIAEQIGSEHYEEILNEQILLDVVNAVLEHLDEPMADPSLLPTYLLSKLAARSVKVVVSGDGGDEIWGGYPTYQAHRYAQFYSHFPEFIRKKIIEPIVRGLPIMDRYQSLEWKLKRFVLRWDNNSAARHLRWMSNLDVGDLNQAVSGFDNLQPITLNKAAQCPAYRDFMNGILALDFKTYLSGSVLAKVDRASMAFGLEVRPPFLDNKIIDWASSLPSRVKLKRLKGKFLLKKAIEGKVPEHIIHRRKKGFAVPLARWLRGPLRSRIEGVLASSPLWSGEVFSQDAFRTWNQQHQNSQIDYSRALWALLVLDSWVKRENIQVG